MSKKDENNSDKEEELEEGEIRLGDEEGDNNVSLFNLCFFQDNLNEDKNSDDDENQGFFLNSKFFKDTFINRKRERPDTDRNKNDILNQLNRFKKFNNDLSKNPKSKYDVPKHLTFIERKNFKRDLCKFFLNGHCDRGAHCTFSHETKNFPCKIFHIHGICPEKERCK